MSRNMHCILYSIHKGGRLKLVENHRPLSHNCILYDYHGRILRKASKTLLEQTDKDLENVALLARSDAKVHTLVARSKPPTEKTPVS